MYNYIEGNTKMYEIFKQLISILTGDATLTAMIPAANITTGPFDVVTEAQASLYYPHITLNLSSESTRSIPTGTRDTLVSLDIFSNTSQLEVDNIYERIITLLEYYNTMVDATAVIFWMKVSGASDQFESSRRIWNRSVHIIVWSQKPQLY